MKLYFDHTKCTYISLKCEICSRKYKYRHYKNNPPKQKQDQGCHQNIPAPHRYKMKKIINKPWDKFRHVPSITEIVNQNISTWES